MKPSPSHNEAVKVLVPVGALGIGVSAAELEAGVADGAEAIALDAGSTDSGPAYLATGESKYGRQSTKRDLQLDRKSVV